MKNKKNFLSIIFAFIFITLGCYFLINSIISNNKFVNLKSFLNLNNQQKQLILKYIFPYKFISVQEKRINQYEQKMSQQSQTIDFIIPHILDIELKFKEIGNDIKIKESDFKLSNLYNLKKYKLLNGFYIGIHNQFPGSGYIDFYQNDLFILSSRGILAYTNYNNLNSEGYFKQTKNNINEFLNLKQISRNGEFSLKDLFIYKNKVFISYNEEIKKDCWSTGVIYGDINYENIKFKKLFSPTECVNLSNIDNEFNPIQSGGRMISFDNNHILVSVGDYRLRHLAQNKESIHGKIIKINIDNGEYEIISMGHRNPQGIYLDKENNFILETEHGPRGGDEINLIEVNKINKDKILNFGWAIVSAGEHYGGKNEDNKKKYEKYPLYKSHSKYGFIEPLKSFVPSIGISEIAKIKKNKYVVSSLRDKSLYFFELNKEKKIINLDRIEVLERIRDLRFYDNKLYLFLEDTASIGVINLNL